MAKVLTRVDALTMRMVGFAAENHAAEPAATHTLVEHLLSEAHLFSAAVELLAKERLRLRPMRFAARGVELVAEAEKQTFGLLSAARYVLPHTVAAPEVPDILRASTAIGRIFGAVSGEPRGKRLRNDEAVLTEITRRPDRYLRYDAGAVKYSDAGKALVQPHMRPDAGCPALHHTVQLGVPGPFNLFNAAWADFTEKYISERVAPDAQPAAAPIHIDFPLAARAESSFPV